jgi:uncharacterized repeat protein (TIGR03803 family)
MNNRGCALLLRAALIFAIAIGASVANAQNFSVLYDFGGNSGDPLGPTYTGLIAQGRDGNLYSTSLIGGTQGRGTVFKITQAGDLTVLYNFPDPSNGQNPRGGLTLGTDGNLYGTTSGGGTSEVGDIFKITPSGRLIVLYNFTGQNDGGNPYAPPVEGSDGNLYGTTSYSQVQGCGAVYKITPSGVLSTLHTFVGSDGCFPLAPLVQGVDGDFYGTTSLGGDGNFGEVFKISASGELTILSSLNGADGGNPYAPVLQGIDGNFYGTAYGWGGADWGTIFEVSSGGVLTDLYTFTGNNGNGGPSGGLVQELDGTFYGAASGGGFAGSNGDVYSLDLSGDFSTLYTFDGESGSDPNVTLLQHTNGLLYGDTTQGGAYTYGTFYSLNVGSSPFVRLLPGSGIEGRTIGFLGQGFTGTTSVSFNGASARFSVVSDTYLTATVPVNATTGPVAVSTPAGKLTSNQPFRVLATVTARP